MQSMQLTDWLVVIFVVAIVVVLIDGVRRKLAERRSRVVMKLDRNIPKDIDPEELPNSELPNGGARALVRDDTAVPSLRTLQARRKRLFKSSRHTPAGDDTTARAVPVLLDTVDVEEERIEHTNVFADPHDAEAFEADDFASADSLADDTATPGGRARAPVGRGGDDADEFIDGLDEEYEEDAMLAEPIVARKEPGYMETRYQGRDDDLEDELEDDEDELEDDEDEDEEEEDFDEFDDDEEEFDDEDDEEDDDDLDDDDDYDDDEDEDDDDFDDDEEEEEDDEEEDEDDLDELEGLPEDDWGAEEEEGSLVDDYENEPMPLQGAFDKAASQFDKVASHAATQLDKVATTAASQFDKVAATAATQFDRFNRPPTAEQPRIEPGFGSDVGGEESFDDAFTEDFSAAFDDDDDVSPVRESLAPQPERSAAPVRPVASKREQGDLFPPRDGAPAREPQERGLMAALQKAVPRAQHAPEPVAAAPTPQEVIIINVMARAGQAFHGGDLLGVLQEQGMRLGDMSIFHRHADNHGSGPVMFSMANMVKPGTFDLATMEQFDTPGVSFFLQMPNKLGNMACFEKMLATASAVRTAFDGELKDEHRSVFTRQTVEHCRQRVRDFELKLLSRK